MFKNHTEKNQLQGILIELEKKQKRDYFKLRILQGITLILVITVIVFLRTLVGQAQLQQGIANQIIRFHVLANSDSKQDQQLKLKVKDKITSYLQESLKKSSTKEEAQQIITQQMEKLKEIAENEIRKQGYSYAVTVKLETCYFPVKQYGDLTFPAGEYEALRVLIGKAEGKNWWCVMFPSLCFVNETYSVVPDDSKDKLKHVLKEEEYEAIETTPSQNQEAIDSKLEEKETVAPITESDRKDPLEEEKPLEEEPNIIIGFHLVEFWNNLWD